MKKWKMVWQQKRRWARGSSPPYTRRKFRRCYLLSPDSGI